MIRAFVFLVSLALPATSVAQVLSSAAIDDVRENARVQAGPFYATPTVHLKELGLDSNVFNEAGEQKSDFTVTVMPKADVWVPVAQRALLKATVATDLVWYATYDAERAIEPQLTTRGEVYLQRITLFGENAYVNSRQRPNHEIDVRSRHVEDSTAAGVQVALTPSFAIEVAGRQSRTRYDADAIFDGTRLERTLNRDTRGVEITARHRLTPLTSLAVRFDTLRDEFVFAPIRDAESYRIMPGIEFKPAALITGSAHVGFRKFTPLARDVLSDYSGLVARLGLSYTLLGSTSFAVTYRRDLTYSYEELQPFFVENSVGASIRRALGRRFDVLVSADRHAYEYRDALTAELPIAALPRVDVTWNYAASLGYRLGRDARVGFGVSYWERDSSTKQFRDYDNLRIGSSLSYGF
jgi:hypothetical protein